MLCYSAVNKLVLAAIPPTAERVLDVGCGSGALGAELRRGGERQITGITFSAEEKKTAEQYLSEVHLGDLNHFDFTNIGQFDCAICSHVLEHLYEPLEVLRRVVTAVRPGGTVIVALPNIAHWKPRLKIARGHFEYTSGGIMDSTHFRFFNRRSAIGLVRETGLSIRTVMNDGYLPLRGVRKVFPNAAKRIDKFATDRLPNLLAWQFVIAAER